MDASSLATTGVHPGNPFAEALFARFEKARSLFLVSRLVAAMEAAGQRGPSLDMHRSVRDRLSRELAL